MSGIICLRTDDAATLSRLHRECFDEGWSEESFRALLANPAAFALRDTASLGFIVVQTAYDESEVLTLGVTPAARRRGIAAALIDTSVNMLFEREIKTLFLEVDCANNQAVALYNRCGFTPMGRRPGYYHHKDGKRSDALTLRMDIRARRVGNRVQLG